MKLVMFLDGMAYVSRIKRVIRGEYRGARCVGHYVVAYIWG